MNRANFAIRYTGTRNVSTESRKLNHYQVLGLERSCSPLDVRRKYVELCKTCHPDTVSSEEDKAAAKKQFQTINEAYNILIKETRRRAYDESLRTGGIFGQRRPVYSSAYERRGRRFTDWYRVYEDEYPWTDQEMAQREFYYRRKRKEYQENLHRNSSQFNSPKSLVGKILVMTGLMLINLSLLDAIFSREDEPFLITKRQKEGLDEIVEDERRKRRYDFTRESERKEFENNVRSRYFSDEND